MALTINLSRKFLNPKYSDLEVRCGEKSFKVHRAVVCTASEVMAMEVDDAVTEGGMRVIEHTRFEAHILDKMFQFMYREEYSFDPVDSMATIATGEDGASMALSLFSVDEITASEGVDRLSAHVHVHTTAKHYELVELELSAASKFSIELESQGPLSSEDFISIAVVVYKITTGEPSALQKEILSAALEHRKEYLSQKAFLNAIVEQRELRLFAESFLAGVTSIHETELANVVQDFQSELEKLQGELQDAVREKDVATRQSAARISNITKLNVQISILNKELQSQKQTHVEALYDTEELHKYNVRGLISEKAKVDGELRAAQGKIKTLEAKQTLHNNTVASLNYDIDSLRTHNDKLQTDLNNASLSSNTADQVVNQLLGLNGIVDCRHCFGPLIYDLERYGPTGYLARCVDCRTRHFAGPNKGSI